MFKKFLSLVAFAVVFIPLNASADQIPNGCGPKGYGWIVPDSTVITQCKFTKACNIHDVCYSRCAEGGDLHGLPTCTNEAERQVRKKKCDKDFFENISYFNSDRRVCRLYGKVYASAVSKGGGGFFQGYRNPELFFEDISTKPAEIDKLLNQLDQQILVEPPVDEQQPLIILKLGDSYNLGEVSNNSDIIEKLAPGSADLAPAFKLRTNK